MDENFFRLLKEVIVLGCCFGSGVGLDSFSGRISNSFFLGFEKIFPLKDRETDDLTGLWILDANFLKKGMDDKGDGEGDSQEMTSDYRWYGDILYGF